MGQIAPGAFTYPFREQTIAETFHCVNPAGRENSTRKHTCHSRRDSPLYLTAQENVQPTRLEAVLAGEAVSALLTELCGWAEKLVRFTERQTDKITRERR